MENIIMNTMKGFLDGTYVSDEDLANAEEFVKTAVKIIEQDKRNGTQYSKKSYQQLLELAKDLFYCIEDFNAKMQEKYKNPIVESHEIEEVLIADYGSGEYVYERLSKAKVACKEAVRKLCNDMCDKVEIQKKSQLDICKEWCDRINDDILIFLDEYQEAFDDYAEADCEGESKQYADSIKAIVADKENLLQIYNKLNLLNDVNLMIEKTYKKQTTYFSKVQECFEKCTYDKNNDEKYCYNMEPIEFLRRVFGQDFNNKEDMAQPTEILEDVLHRFLIDLKRRLLLMFSTDIIVRSIIGKTMKAVL